MSLELTDDLSSRTHLCNTLDDQDSLEGHMVGLGFDRFVKNQKGLDVGETYSGKKFLLEVLPKVSPILDAWKEKQATTRRKHVAFKHLLPLNSELLVYIGIGRALCYQGVSLTKLLNRVGTIVADHIHVDLLEAANKDEHKKFVKWAATRNAYRNRKALLKRFIEKQEGLSFLMEHEDNDTGRMLIKLGEPVVDAILQGLPDLFQKVCMFTGPSRTEARIILTEAGLKWFAESDARKACSTPRYLPMLVPPEDWSEDGKGGGYVSSRIRPYSLMRSFHGGTVSPEVVDAVNLIQQTPYRINSRMLETVQWAWANDMRIGKMPPAALADTPGLVTEEEPTEEEMKAHKGALVKTHKANRELTGQIAMFDQQLQTATLFDKADRFWFPYMLDFRGRVYPKPGFNHQQSDPIKSMIEFADGQPLGERGAMWLAIHLANCGDFDKISKETFQARVDWVDNNEDLIMAIDADPQGNVDMWKDADKPYSFLAACMDYAGFLRAEATCEGAGEGHVSHTAVALDGSCSGIQLYSAALRDEVGGKHVNLIPSDIPQDIYMVVADKVIADVQADADAGEAIAIEWMAVGITRKTVKRNVMTFPYSSGQYGFSDQILEDTVMLLPEGTFEDKRLAANYLAKIVWKHVQGTVVKAAEAMNWLKKCAGLLAREGKPLVYITPLGLKVVHAYHDYEKIEIDSSLLQRFRAVLNGKPKLRKDGGYVFTGKQKSACAPNVIHSLDATLLMLAVINAKQTYGIESFQLIHDSFATHAAMTDGLFACVRESLVQLFTEVDVFQSIYDQVHDALSETGRKDLTLPPSKGTLDLNAVQDSMYAFA